MIRFAAAAVLLLTFATATLADLIIEARETGGDVVFATSGSLDLTGWFKGSGFRNPFLHPARGELFFGTGGISDAYFFDTNLSPTSYGTGGLVGPNSTSGDAFGFWPSGDGAIVFVETDYVFGDPINATMTFEDATIDSLGINPGDTVWSWLAVEPASLDVSPIVAPTSSITLRAIAIPEPSAFACIGLIGLVASGRSWWKRRR